MTNLVLFSLCYSTKGVGGTAPDMSQFETIEDGLVVPLGKPKEQADHKVPYEFLHI